MASYLSSFHFPENGNDPTTTSYVSTDPLVEPIAGPPRVMDLMDRFPDTVYAQGPDTHLYKFLETLCGDAGAGLLRKQTYITRILGEAEVMSYSDLDNFYTTHFRFQRIRPEVYSFDVDVEALTPDEWADVQLKDSRYRHRAQKFFNATRLGGTPLGMAMAAEGGSGVECEVREHYRYIYDQYSDDKLGLEPHGRSASSEEFVVMPRVYDSTGTLNEDYSYELQHASVADFNLPSYDTVRPMRMDRIYVTEDYVPRDAFNGIVNLGWVALTPDIHRNMLDTLDRLRPVGSLMTVKPQQCRHVLVEPSPVVDASTERFLPTRFVNGSPDVAWPDPNSADAQFIEGGIEKQAVNYADGQIEMPDVFHTIDAVFAYTDEALLDSSYNTSSFLTTTFPTYQSEHTGTFPTSLSDVYPVLRGVPTDQKFGQEQVLAPSTLPIFISQWRSS